jgi:hypothetical protein
LVGPVYAHVPPDLQLEFKWLFNDVLAPAPPVGGTSPAVPHWKSVIIRAIGNMLHALMIFGVSYNVVTHASQHNPDGSHKTIQAEGTTRREDGGKTTLETGDLKSDENGPPNGAALDGVLTDRQCEPHRPSWVDEIKAMLAEVRAGVVGLAMGPPKIVEPVSDCEARRLFALVTALELETNFRKAPVIRVFMLYCRDGETRKVVARECKCSPALITLRLQAIENKLGRKAAELRQISGHFEQIADSLTDSRARRIDRRRAIDGAGRAGPDDPADDA